MKKQNSFKLNQLYAVMLLFCIQNAFAANFNIASYGTLPTTVTLGQSVSAYFTVTNMTHTTRNGYVLQGLPSTVTQNTTSPNCTNPINLGPNASCQLQLDITGAVSSKFALCKGNACTTSSTPLNVSVAASNFAYVADGSSNLWQCPINKATGVFSSGCTALTNTPTAFNTTYGTTFATFSGVTYAYVADASTKLWQCPMNATGGISGGECAPLTNTPAFSQTQATTFATFSGTTYAYVGDSSHTLWQCPMSATGGISGDCTALTNTPSAFSYTNYTTFATFSGVTYAYMADGSQNLWQCPINNATGLFSSGCTALTNTPSAFQSINDITFATFSGVTYAYVSDGSTNLWQCPMSASGGISSGCTALTPTTFYLTATTTFITLSGVTYAYVTDDTSNVWQCPMNATGGISDSSCTLLTNDTFPGFSATLGLVFFAP